MENFIIAKATDVGKTREVNEDSMTVFDSPNGRVMVVCDGMGGMAAGDVASKLAVSIIESLLTENTFNTPEEAIRSSIMAANQVVVNKAAQNPELEGMGSTCVMLIIKNGLVYCGWVGDSRIYYVENNSIRQISHDQSYVQQLVDAGEITAEQAASHPQKNEITNCIGLPGMTPPEVLSQPINPRPGSTFLLCSDGLSGMVGENEINQIISAKDLSLQQKADKLIEMANRAGGLDNITVELVRFGSSDTVGATSGTLFMTPEGVNNKRRKGMPVYLYSLAGLIVVIALFIATKVFFFPDKPVEKDKTEVSSTSKKTTAKPKATTKQTSTPVKQAPAQPKAEAKPSAPAAPTAPNNQKTTTPKNEKRGVQDVVDKSNNTVEQIKDKNPKEQDPGSNPVKVLSDEERAKYKE